MKSWTYGINSHHRTASYELEEGPWWAFLVRWLSDRICDLVPAIPLPPLPLRDDEGQPSTLREQWGDTFQWVHTAVHVPIFEWAEGKIRRHLIDASYDEVRRRHYTEDRSFFDEEDSLWAVEGERPAP